MTSTALPPVPSIDPLLFEKLRVDFLAANFTVDGIDALLSPMARGALERENAIPAIRELDAVITSEESTPDYATALLTRVFTLGGAATGAQVEAAVPSLGADGFLALGLLVAVPADSDARDQVRYRATVDLRPYAATDNDGDILWWVASDLGEMATGQALAGEHVLGIGGATSTLIAITPRVPVERALDVGCGCGIQALHAARHARTVIATDISERALAFTDFNVALNSNTLPAHSTVETRVGSMLEPVAGETFDLIVSNPPFVITPRTESDSTWTYRDGGQVGDRIVEELVRSLHLHLTPGGTAAMLANWEITRGTSWDTRPRGWLAQSPANAVVIQRDTEDPASYASTWLRDGGVTDRDDRWVPMMNAWLDDFASRDVEAIGFGHVLLRMPSAIADGNATEQEVPEPYRVLDAVETTGNGPLGPRYVTMLETLDVLSRASNAALRELPLTRADDVVERRHFTPGAEDPMVIDLVQGGGFGRTAQLDTHTAGILGVLTGEYSFGTLLDAYGALLEQAGQGEARPEVEAQIMARMRELLTWGFMRVRP